MSARSDASRVGIALGSDTVVAVVGGGPAARVVSAPVALAGADDPVQALESGLRELRVRLSAVTGRTDTMHVSIALMPPLSDTRVLTLPPLRLREAEAVIRRDVARYFVGGSAARTVGIARAAAGACKGDAAPATAVLAAAAPTATLEAVRAAATRVGWVVDAVAPAHGAWIGAAAGARVGAILAVAGDGAVVIGFEDGEVNRIRQLPSALLDEIVGAAGSPRGEALVFAGEDAHDAFAGALRRAGWTVRDGRGDARSALELAALHAQDSPIVFVPPSVVAERWRRSRTLGRRMAIAAVGLIILAAAIEVWGTRRELNAVRERRAAIRPQVAPLLASRDSIEQLRERADAIRSLEEDAPRWTRALFDLALLLPADAHVTTLRTRGDTLVIEASGARAGEALQALRRAGSLTDLRLEGVVDRDLEDGSTAVERFRLSARLRRPLPTGPIENTSRAVARRRP